MAVINIQGIRKQFDDITAVDGVDLSVNEGEFLVILGPSGCGKTTLMRMIAGLEKPTSGAIHIGDRDVTHLPPRARQVAMVFQSYALYPHKSVFENIVFPLKAQKVPREQWQEKVEAAANLLGLGRLLDRKPRQLSGGERQRVALARAMVRDPMVMLLDEPLSNLDAKLRATARDELQRFQRRLGVTTIFVTHDQIEAMGMGDRIAVMYQGKVRQIGTPTEVYKDSADTFVAAFLGSPGINLLERDEFTLGFRPENFLPKETLERRADVVDFRFRVGRIEYLGADRLLFGHVEGSDEDAITISKLPSAVNLAITPGEIFDFAVERDDLRFYDKHSGTRIEPRPLG
jgi:multiple sugar transport system ATP-binding protein